MEKPLRYRVISTRVLSREWGKGSGGASAPGRTALAKQSRLRWVLFVILVISAAFAFKLVPIL